MKREVTGKEMVTKFLDRIAITARIAVESGECTAEEILDYIKEYGNEKIANAMEMEDKDFALLAMLELVKTSMELREELSERREDNGKEEN